ncbi:MAG: HAD-IC family P-type ATPase [Lacisediminihabitans sp.]
MNQAGLSSAEVSDLVARGLGNATKQTTSRPLWHIIRDNTFTLFNAVLTVCFIAVIILGDLRDGFFYGIVVFNSLIGIVQELRAKLALDRLAVLAAPHVAVRRDGETVIVAREEVVLGDTIVLRPGDQVVADGTVTETNELSIDESLLTGESEPTAKLAGDPLFSGALVVAGTGRAVVTAVGNDSYASRLTAEIRRHSLAFSELRGATNRILVYISWALGPIVLLVLATRAFSYKGQFTLDALGNGRWREALLGVVASVVGMIPEGLVLLISLAFGVAALRLAQQRVLIQELAAVEILARVDVLCLDKTGTLTNGEVAFEEAILIEEVPGWHAALALFGNDDAANLTAAALASDFAENGAVAAARIPFSSRGGFSGLERGWAGGGSSWLLGAPERLLARHPVHLGRAAGEAARGRRTLALVRLVGGLPTDVDADPTTFESTPVAILLFGESIRADAAETLGYFAEQGVRVIIISGDNPATVAAIATELGVGTSSIDAQDLADDEQLRAALREHSIFGRVTPEQKRSMVRLLQEDGHVVAMTGDGVNDAMAIKEADLGIAMGSATSASKAVARLVLLDNRFDRLPEVLGYGRRVIANVERVANLFLAKTVYGVIFAIVFAALLWDFPFLPRQLTLVSTLTIGIPSFLLALAPNHRRYEAGILRRLVNYALPTGVVAAVATGASYALARSAVPLQEARTISTVTLFVVAFWVLCVLSRPLNWWRGLLLFGMSGGFVAVLVAPWLRDFFALHVVVGPQLLLGVVLGLLGAAGIEFVYRIARRRRMIFDRE